MSLSKEQIAQRIAKEVKDGYYVNLGIGIPTFGERRGFCFKREVWYFGTQNDLVPTPHTLKGIQMTSPDIRAGVSLLIAALSAEGTSTILNIERIDRGYENIEERLLNLGAQIRRL